MPTFTAIPSLPRTFTIPHEVSYMRDFGRHVANALTRWNFAVPEETRDSLLTGTPHEIVQAVRQVNELIRLNDEQAIRDMLAAQERQHQELLQSDKYAAGTLLRGDNRPDWLDRPFCPFRPANS